MADIHLSDNEKLIKILSDKNICKSVAKFTCQAFEDRKNSLEILSTINDMIDVVQKKPTADLSSLKSYSITKTSNDGMRITIASSSDDIITNSYKIKHSSNNGLKVTLTKSHFR